jgi:hypothetical protein
MTAIAGLCFQALFGERPFTGANRSLDRKSATDAFGSGLAGRPVNLAAAKLSSGMTMFAERSRWHWLFLVCGEGPDVGLARRVAGASFSASPALRIRPD